jgi:hypothetical protein
MASQNAAGRVSFLGLLTLLFIGLKLGRVIAWPWLLVLAPLWLPIVSAFLFGLLAVLAALLVPRSVRSLRYLRSLLFRSPSPSPSPSPEVRP